MTLFSLSLCYFYLFFFCCPFVSGPDINKYRKNPVLTFNIAYIFSSKVEKRQKKVSTP